MSQEALALAAGGELQDADPALPPSRDEQLLPGGHQEHRGPGLVAAERMHQAVGRSHQSVPQTHVPVVC